MNRRTKLALAIAFILLFYVLLVFWWANSNGLPYESPPAHTLKEERAVKRAIKIHGVEYIITTKTKIYFERDGREILIARRGL